MDNDSARAILAANLRRIIEADTLPGERFSVRAWALSRELDVRLIDRLVKGEHAVTLDKLEAVAAACGLQSWQLLVPNFDPKNQPETPISEQDRALIRRLRRILDDPSS
jgi:hypothetical protein